MFTTKTRIPVAYPIQRSQPGSRPAMVTQGIQILDPDTGKVVDECRGPTPSGRCPRAGKGGVVPCAGYLLRPRDADRWLWPVSVPRDYRYCDLEWTARAIFHLTKAEACREKWEAGKMKETSRVFRLAGSRDPRYRKMTPRQLRTTGYWCWRLSTPAIQLLRSENHNREQARMYLAFAEFRRLHTLQRPRSSATAAVTR